MNPRSQVADPFGRLVGTLVAATFGVVFVVANTGAFPTPWAVALRIAAVVAAVVLAVGATVVFRRAARVGEKGGAPFGRGYWFVVAVEAAALVAGLWLVNGVLGRPDLGVVWVALVVGVHFLVLGRLWRFGIFTVLGAVMTALGVLAALLGAVTGSELVVQLLAGVGSGAALLGFGATGVTHRAD